jgi:hypothetical protein
MHVDAARGPSTPSFDHLVGAYAGILCATAATNGFPVARSVRRRGPAAAVMPQAPPMGAPKAKAVHQVNQVVAQSKHSEASGRQV